MNKKKDNFTQAEDISLTENNESIAELYACHTLRAAYAYLGYVKGYTFTAHMTESTHVVGTACAYIAEIINY